jgi:hypothetical protein
MDALTRSRTQSLILGGIALGALYLVGFAIIASSAFAEAPDRIAFGVALDLTVTATAVVWWLGCKRAGLPPWIAVAAFGWGVMVARLWVPHAPIQMLIALGGITEAITVSWALLRIRRFVRTARAARDRGSRASRSGSRPSPPARSTSR